MNCNICGKWFSSSDPMDTICISCERNKTIMTLFFDRDRWKARAEALERAARNSFLEELCGMCLHEKLSCSVEPCSSCMHPGNGDGDNWQFDEARFAGGKEDA